MTRKCLFCNKIFKTRLRKSKFCSTRCSNSRCIGKPSWNKGLIFIKEKLTICKNCGITFKYKTCKSWEKRHPREYCSHRCAGLNNLPKVKRGKYSPTWRGGLTLKNHGLRFTTDYKLWRKEVLERDNFTCQKYGIRGGKLIAHHKDGFDNFPELRLIIDNGITFSKKAHQEFHNQYGWRKNIKEQSEEFLKEQSLNINQ
jgi:hypothetical protein